MHRQSKLSCHLPWDKLSQRSVEFVDIPIGSKSIGAGMRRPNSSVWKDNQDLLYTASYYLLVRSRTLVSIGMRRMILSTGRKPPCSFEIPPCPSASFSWIRRAILDVWRNLELVIQRHQPRTRTPAYEGHNARCPCSPLRRKIYSS